MSALPQRVHAPVPKSKAKLVLRPRGIHHGSYRAEIVAKYERSKWAGRALSLHLHRVTSGCAQAAWILFVYHHTVGSSDAKEREMEWSHPLLPEDCAKECGLSVQMIRDARRECVAKGFTPRKSSAKVDGKEFYRFHIDYAKMAAAPNACEAREDVFVPRKPVRSAEPVVEEKANSADSEAGCEESRESVLSPDAVVIPPGAVAVAAKLEQPGRVEVTHSLPCPVAYTSTFSARGNVRIHLTSPVSPGSTGEPGQAGSRVAQPGSTSTLAGPGLSADSPPLFTSVAGWKEFAQACAGLSTSDGKTGMPLYLDEQYASQQVARLKCPLDFFVHVTRQRVDKAVHSRKPFTSGLLPSLVGDANKKWEAGGNTTWESRPVPESAEDEQARRIARNVEESRKWR